MGENILSLVDQQNIRRIFLTCKGITTVNRTDRIVLNGINGVLSLGGNGKDGMLRIFSTSGATSIWMDGKTGKAHTTGGISTNGAISTRQNIYVGTSADDLTKASLHLDGAEGNIVTKGKINLQNKNGDNCISVRAVTGNDDSNVFACSYDGNTAGLYVGSHNTDKGKKRAGHVTVRNSEGNDCIVVNGNTGGGDIISVRAVTTKNNLNIFACSSDVESNTAGLYVGSHNTDKGKKRAGHISIRDENGNDSIVLKGRAGDPANAGRGGAVRLFDANGESTIGLAAQQSDGTAAVRVGGKKRNGQIILKDDQDREPLTLDAKRGDILLHNADCAEDFDIAESEKIEPGSVMVLNHEGKLQQSNKAYDKKVAGVISGAGNLKPGIILGKNRMTDNSTLPLALMGKVYCKVDAQFIAVRVGDLLTTSSTRGHAMKATDAFKSFGAVIGKALGPLGSGQGLIPILVALQ
jgi:hypothetical protein